MEPIIQYAVARDGVDIAMSTLGAGPPVVFLPVLPLSHLQVEWEMPGLREFLERFAEHEREVERRRSQEALRTIPVRLLPPLICCILPAFCLTTVVPVIAAVIGSLGIGRVLGG